MATGPPDEHDTGMILLVPADVLRPRAADDHFADEADAARAAGLDVVLVDHDAASRTARTARGGGPGRRARPDIVRYDR